MLVRQRHVDRHHWRRQHYRLGASVSGVSRRAFLLGSTSAVGMGALISPAQSLWFMRGGAPSGPAPISSQQILFGVPFPTYFTTTSVANDIILPGTYLSQ